MNLNTCINAYTLPKIVLFTVVLLVPEGAVYCFTDLYIFYVSSVLVDKNKCIYVYLHVLMMYVRIDVLLPFCTLVYTTTL